MNITSHNNSIPVATVVNPSTDSLRRDNSLRERIIPPEAVSHAAAEKGVASDKDRARTPAQDNEKIDFERLQKQAEEKNTTIADSNSDNGSSADQQANQENPQSTESTSVSNSAEDNAKSQQEIRAEELVITKLESRDAEVKAHEMAHSSVGGVATGAPSYSYEIGPDGKKYAVSGEVSVDLSAVEGDPLATIAKMKKVHAAAMAPVNPSIQDSRVAASAVKIIAQAQTEFSNLESPNKPSNSAVSPNFSEKGSENTLNDESKSFDQQIKKTLDAQEKIAPSRSDVIVQRALRVEGFYSGITLAYAKEPNYQFQLTA
ncbi:MAG: hypothetical protein ACI9LM_001611 [Alteromonadaceae bacterium]|jgi:hypothetical protein